MWPCRPERFTPMPSLPVMRVLLRELITTERVPRIPEPDLIMDDPDKVAAFTRAGREDGVMAPVYLYHCAQVCEIVRPGDLVVDLGCGPATQLAMIARLNPESRFLGVDFSEEMLDRAKKHIDAEGLANVQFHKADVTQLGFLADASVDLALFHGGAASSADPRAPRSHFCRGRAGPEARRWN